MQVSKCSKGLSLIELIATIGIMGVVSLGIFNIAKIQQSSTTGNKGTIELGKALNSISALLNEPRSCSISLQGLKLNSTKDINDNERQVFELFTAQTSSMFKEGDAVGTGVYGVKDMYVGTYNPVTHRAEFIVTFEALKQSNSIRSFNRTVYFYPNVDSDTRITNCLRGADKRAEALLEKMCLEIDPSGTCDYSNILLNAKKTFCDNNANWPWIKWNETAQKCELIDSNLACSAGHIQGYDANGEFTCVSPSAFVYNENGACGTFINECTKGDLVPTTSVSSPFSWTCKGTGTGTNASCSANISAVINGECRSSVTNDCVSGVLSDIADTATHSRWNCMGVNGGSNDTCSKLKSLTVVNGNCSATENICTTGGFSEEPDSPTHLLWTCLGSGGGMDDACSIPRGTPPPVTENGECSSPLALNSCDGGTFVDLPDTADYYQWRCLGINDGLNKDCEIEIAKPPICEYNRRLTALSGVPAPGMGCYAITCDSDGKLSAYTECLGGSGAGAAGTVYAPRCEGKVTNDPICATGQEVSSNINGQCNNTVLNDCNTGTLEDIPDTANDYLWKCNGIGAGSDDNCSLAKTSTDFFVVDCGHYVQTQGENESGLFCGPPQGNNCTEAQVGNGFGTTTCREIDLDFGQPLPSHGRETTESCICVRCVVGNTYLPDSACD